jgi:hypothetical protein
MKKVVAALLLSTAFSMRADVWLINSRVLTVDPTTNYALLPNGVLLTAAGGAPLALDTNAISALNYTLNNPTNVATAFPSGAITATGWTNSWTNSLVVTYRGTNFQSWKKRAGALTLTNISYGLIPSGMVSVILKPGQAVVISGTSVSGFFDPL